MLCISTVSDLETILDNAEDLVSFVVVAEEGSFSRAADRLGLTKSTISKRVARLEERLDVRLLRRTTRALHLTDIGSRFLIHASAIVEAAREAEAEVQETQVEMRGRLRINAPVSLGQSHVAQVIVELAQAHPGLEVELDLSDRRVDLVAEGYDLAIRVGDLTDSSSIAQKLLDVRFRVVASPSYLAARGRPKTPKQLESHTCLMYRYQVSGAYWVFKHGTQVTRVRPRGPFLSNHGDVLAKAAVMGLGIALLPGFVVQDDVQSGALVALFSRSCQNRAPIHAVFPPGRRTPKRTRVFVDALKEYFRAAGAGW